MTTNDKNFYSQMLTIAVPIAIQNLIVSSLNTLDTVMISTLGPATIAGVGLANQVFFLFMLICFGIGSGGSVMISQYHGRGDLQSVRKTNAMASLTAILAGLIFSIAALIFPRQIIRLMIQDQAVIEQGAKYLSVVAWSYVITGFSFANGISLRSTGNPRGPLFASILSFFFNAFFNYVFIFGALGFPKLGVVGAAVGTIIARIVEVMVIIYVSRKYQGPLSGNLLEHVSFTRQEIKHFFTITTPVILNETIWALGQVMYSIAYAIVGTESTAAVQVVVAIQNIAFVIIRGLSNACSIMLGNAIGRGHIHKVQKYGIRFLKMGAMTGIIIGSLLYLTPHITLGLFGSLTPSVYEIAVSLLKVMGILYIIKAFNSILIVGVLRGGGDTRYSMLLELFCVWLIGVPLAYFGASIFNLSIEWVVTLATMEEVVKTIFGLFRVRSKKWINEI